MELPEQNRLFVALDVEPSLRSALASFAEQLANALDGRPVAPANLHVTLVFLGQVEKERAPGLHAALSRALASRPGRTRGGALEARPSPRGARLVALSLADEDGVLARTITDVHVAASRALERSDAAARPAWPHVTLVRFSRATRVPQRRLTALADGWRDAAHSAFAQADADRSTLQGASRELQSLSEQVFDFDRAALYDSESRRGGPPRYRALATFPFA